MLVLAIVPSISFATAAFLIQKYRRWSSENPFFYILEVASGQSLLFIFSPIIRRFLAKRYSFEYEAPLTLSVGFYFGSLVIILIALALLHRAEWTIIKRLENADKLTIRLQKDREELIFSDEELRRQTSQFLHDRVQSDLMVVAMKLKSVQGQSSEEVEAVLATAIARLESTRAADLRNLVQILTPNFAGSGLDTAFAILKQQYGSTLNVEFEMGAGVELLSENQQLGVFRIAEQALLNSVVHGPAKCVTIAMDFETPGIAKISITDDGPGVEIEQVKSGVGSAIIDSWVNILKGKKEISSSSESGYNLKVTFPTE
jgi:signal transduction histidine kinase